MLGLAEQILPDAGIVAPRGDVSEHGANRFFRRTGEGVYDMQDLAERTAKMAGFVRAHARAETGAKVYRDRLFQWREHPRLDRSSPTPALFDRIVLMHPLIPCRTGASARARGSRVLVTAGRRDPICPAPLTERLERWLAEQGAKVQAFWHDGGHEVRDEEIVRVASFLKR